MKAPRVQKRVDPQRLAEALSYPGIDPRTWVTTARVDDDPDAVWLDEALYWLVDVTLTGGELDGEGPVTCRVGGVYAANLAGRKDPITRGAEVLVVFTSGDPNANPVIVAQLSNDGGDHSPTEVNGLRITENFALHTHIMKSPHGAQEEYALPWRVSGRDVTLIARKGALQLEAINGPVYLGGLEVLPPNEAVIRGNSFVNALLRYNQELAAEIRAISLWIGAVAGVPVLIPGAAAAAALMLQNGEYQAAVTAFGSAATAALSRKVFTE